MKVLSTTVFRGPNIFARHPVIHYAVDLSALREWSPRRLGPTFVDGLVGHLPGLAEHRGGDGKAGGFVASLGKRKGATLADVLAHATIELQHLAGAEVTFCRARPAAAHDVHDVVYAYREAFVGLRAGELALALIQWLLPEDLRAGDIVGADFDFDRERDRFVEAAVHQALDMSTVALVEAAEARDIPWFRIDPSRRFVQFGHGRYQQRIRETVTDSIGATGAQISRNKSMTNIILGELGLPVPAQRVVDTAEKAVKVVEEMGYPVVVKPLLGGKGTGISVGVASAAEVNNAFALAQNHFPMVLIEKFVAGDDHRMLVVDGKLIAVSRRIPGRVVGDGKRTVEELVEDINRDPRRGTGYLKLLVRLEIDDEANERLAAAGYTRTSVPVRDEAVYLRGTANIATGGTAVEMTSRVHPDNRDVAVLAAAAIGLQVAGIDFLTPDITRSYREVGGGICEVNSSPGLRVHWVAEGETPDVAGPIMDTIYPPGAPSRIPIAAIAGGAGASAAARLLADILGAAGHTVGLANGDGIAIGGKAIVKGAMTGPGAAHLVLRDPTVDAAVLETTPEALLKLGLGYDACDVAAVLGLAAGPGAGDGIDSAEDWARVLGILTGVTRGTLVLDGDEAACRGLAEGTGAHHVCYVTRDARQPAVVAHVNGGGRAVVLEHTPEGQWVSLCDGGDRFSLVQARPEAGEAGGDPENPMRSLMFALAMAHGLGLDASRLRHILAAMKGPDSRESGTAEAG